jgi:hypothetical protein
VLTRLDGDKAAWIKRSKPLNADQKIALEAHKNVIIDTGRNALFSAGVRMENGALGKKFDSYPQRQFVTESSYNNSLEYRHI